MPGTTATARARATRADVDEFLAHRRFAAVGLSRNAKDFSRMLVADFEKRGYEVVPVNPGTREIGGKPCFSRVQDVVPPVEAVLVMTAASKTDEVVRDCATAGVTHVWMHRGGGQGAVSASAVEFCRERGIKVVAGECPFMFLPATGFPHRVHGLIRKILGSYPK